MQLADILAQHTGREGPLLPILHDVQKAFGYISQDAMRQIATALNITRAEVHGVVSFYHDFRTEPVAHPVIKLCRAEACQARGVDALVEALGTLAGVEIEAVYCLGICGVGPAAMVGNEVHARLDLPRLKALVAAL